ncbi:MULTISPECIES: hypothetical protein [Cytobacillus]|uniref:Uncharacterized protein n=1 Tax=Cytobacillus firmus TaxID=1399 RepID=A0AA46SLH5_CYTFI|nr:MULTISPECIES: hypothetical protein [Cytobacillus]MCM3244585.1 hypothetical protein [Cytobacillus oceanisediminis]USK47552.1 hypothetical protein LIT27_28875 [Cytobacillus oceanisediminis]UYG98317.1 hypothetical protein OD459_25960 [Cytobacillus firmus]
MDKWSRRTFISKTLKGTAGVFAISVLPLGLTACNNRERVDTSAMASLGPISELDGGISKESPLENNSSGCLG